MPSLRKLAAEAIGTFMLVSAVLGAALISGNAAGLGMAMAYAVGPISQLWLFIVGPLAGGALGGLLDDFMQEKT